MFVRVSMGFQYLREYVCLIYAWFSDILVSQNDQLLVWSW